MIDAQTSGNAIALRAQAGTTEFFPGRSSSSLGYNGSYLGPTIRVHKGDNVEIAVTNALNEDTSVHWHGLLIPAELDGGPHQLIKPTATWRPVLPIRQPAATLFYHSHVHGRTGTQVYSGLAGVLLVTDEAERALALPSEYGVDDLPLVLQERQFEDEQMVIPQGMMTMMQGRRGNTILVNGTPNATARVPKKLMRLRLVNGSNARIYDISFSDNRMFHWIATEGGLLERPIQLRSLTLAPGERAELLVDFSNGQAVSLRTAPDTNLPMMMGPLAQVRNLASGLFGNRGQDVLDFDPIGKQEGSIQIPDRLIERPRGDASRVTTRRRFVLGMGMGGMMGGGTVQGSNMFINGRAFDMNRVDEKVRLGDTEIWEVTGEMMSHPFHIHGVQFEVLSRNGGKPAVRDSGTRDTVLIREPVELLVRFDHPAEKAPFMYHCHIFEHEDSGMMGQFVTG
jgi:FtsP/CotA-like multicopper oxidase with cupredoxin domain